MTLASMTGFGRAQGPLSDRLAASVVVRSVNHKFLDVVVRTNTRDELPELEAAVRSAVAEELERGRVTVQIDFEHLAPFPVRVVVNSDAVTSALEQLAELALPETVTGGVTLGDLVAIPGMVTTETAASQPEPAEADTLAALARQAVAQLVSMRQAEGARLGAQIRADLAETEAFVDWFEPRIEEFRQAIFTRLQGRLSELLGVGGMVEPERQIQEAAVLADRADVSEEIVRLRSHVAGFLARLDTGGAVGRTLDFMCQEILRELNTLGSKCRELGVADRVVDAKAALERVREQVQNIE